ncbi:MAG: ABC-F family ATP-binding cassette domain-containing protein [Lachnospiraceae bacterium]|nr:ABC-F family ATP-binding cassette domain-containing protein [Lachnospiraceae bacterium]
MSMIKVENLTFSYPTGGDNIFENVSFQIDSSWKLGLIGRNGRGKTTLFRLLMGEYEYSGNIYAGIPFDYFPYHVPHPEEMTLDVLSQICPQAEDWELMRECNYLEVDAEVLYRPFTTLSNGEQTKVLLAALFLNEDHFLLIDEPTNHQDVHAREIVSDYLRKKKGFILISHDRAFTDRCVDHILALNKNDIQVTAGSYSVWWENKQNRDAFELAANSRLKKEIGRLSEAARQSSGWSEQVESSKRGNTNSGSKLDKGFVGHKAAKMMKRSKNLEARQQSAIEEKAGLLKNIETADPLQMFPLRFRGELLAKAEEVCIHYEDGTRTSPVTLEIQRGDRIVLDGKNGSGKSSFLKLLLQENAGTDSIIKTQSPNDTLPETERIAFVGKLQLPFGLIISYVSQKTDDLFGSPADYAERYQIDQTLYYTLLRKLGLERAMFEKNIEDFSEGQKKKVLLARSLCERAHLYIWDEPLNYLDIYSRMQLEDVITEYSPTMLLVEHDAMFREKVGTQVIQL